MSTGDPVADLVCAAKCVYDQATVSDCYKHFPWVTLMNLREAWQAVERRDEDERLATIQDGIDRFAHAVIMRAALEEIAEAEGDVMSPDGAAFAYIAGEALRRVDGSAG